MAFCLYLAFLVLAIILAIGRFPETRKHDEKY